VYVQNNIFKYGHELSSGILSFRTCMSTLRLMPLTPKTAQKMGDSES